MKCILLAGADQRFQVRGGGGALKKMARRAEGGANMFGLFRVKNHDLTITNHIFFQFKGAGGGSPPPGSAPDLQYLQTNDDGKSGVHLSAILRFDFCLPLVVCSHICTLLFPL